MQNMIKRLREKEDKLAKKEGGFTLVELIVVLVILAILAAILVPTLVGYINQANREKDYSTAQTVRVAAQSVESDLYGRATDKTTAPTQITLDTKTTNGQTVSDLAGVDTSHVTGAAFAVENGQVKNGTVVIDGHNYNYDATNNSWSVSETDQTVPTK